MPSTYTTNTGIEKIATGEQSGTWGDTTNTNFDIIDRAVNGVGSIALSGTTHTLSTADGSLSDGMYRVLVFGGTPSGTNTVTIEPDDAQKVYLVLNNSGEDVILSQGSGTTVTVADGTKAVVYADGGGPTANVVDLTVDLVTLGITASAAEINLLDGVTATTAEINYLDITALGTSEASKVVTADANGNVRLSEELQATAYIETAVSVASTSIDCDEGNVFYKTISSNTTFSFSYSGVNLTTDDAYAFTLFLTASGTVTTTWPASVKWNNGDFPPPSPEDGETDIYVFVTRDGGTNWYGFQAGDAMA